MVDDDPRAALATLVTASDGESLSSLSRLLGRNEAYLQQFVKRGSPRRLAEADRALLARYFGVDEAVLGGRRWREPLPGSPYRGSTRACRRDRAR